jgi:hypothetical protein
VRRRLLLAAEFACDDWVLAGGADGPAYAETLLGLLPAPPAIPAAPAATSQLAARVPRLLSRGRVAAPELGRAWGRPALALALILTTWVALLHARPGPRPHAGAGPRPAGVALARPAW